MENETASASASSASASASAKMEHDNQQLPKTKGPSSFERKFKEWFGKNYMKTLAVPIILFILACFSFGYHYKTTGSFVDKDIDFSGGTIVTLNWNHAWGSPDTDTTEAEVSAALGSGVSVRELKEYTGGATIAVVAESSSDVNSSQLIDAMTASILKKLPEGVSISPDEYSTRFVKPVLGNAFFSGAMWQIACAFLLLGIVVFFVFRNTLLSVLTISCVFLNVFEAFAFINILGMKLSLGTFTALLGIIAYSVDDNVLIATKLLKQKKREAVDNAYDGMRTSFMIWVSFVAALSVLYIVSSVPMIREIALLFMLGESADILNTWFQNTPLLMWYVERQEKKAMQLKASIKA